MRVFYTHHYFPFNYGGIKTTVLLLSMLFAMNRAIAQEEENVITFRAGDFSISVLSEGLGQGNAGMLKGATPEQLKKYLPDGTFPLETQVFLLRIPGKNILVDAGHGKNLSHNLQAVGLDETKIHAVLLTHLHGDHIGGLLRNGKPAFPNAEIYLSQAEHDYWKEAGEKGAAARNALEAYRGKVHLFEPSEPVKESPELFPGVQAIATYGHTPGHTAYYIRSDDARWLIWGDLVHATPIQMSCPNVAIAFDVDAEKAVRTRMRILEFVSLNNITIGGMHIPFPAVGHLKKAASGDGYLFSATCLCEGI